MRHFNAIQPCSILSRNIYDISQKNGKLILTSSPYDRLRVSLNGGSGELIHCPHNLAKIYLFESDDDTINITVNGTNYPVNPNRYPETRDQIVFCAFVKNEDSYIKQWIDYHHKLGVDKFIIYDNAGVNDKSSYCSSEDSSNLESLLSEYINNKLVCLIKWPYPKRVNGCVVGQVTQQNHTLYNFYESKYIGFLDIDEYLNPQKHSNILDMINDLKQKGYNEDRHGGIKIKNKFFYNPDKLNTQDTNFLKIYNCDHLTQGGREKNILNPRQSRTIAIHETTSGKKCFTVSHRDCILNHYYYLNKDYRGFDRTNLIDKSISKHIIK